MCRSKAEGGQRCSAHTRQALRRAYKDLEAADDVWPVAGREYAPDTPQARLVAALSEHASTPKGRTEIERKMAVQVDPGRREVLSAALSAGDALRRQRSGGSVGDQTAGNLGPQPQQDVPAGTRSGRPVAEWTRRRAGYVGSAQTMSRSAGLTTQYVPTQHGLVARTWMSSNGAGGLAEVALRRRSNRNATFQGFVERTENGWVAYDPDGEPVSPAKGDYLDAEAALLPLRTGELARWDGYQWPKDLL